MKKIDVGRFSILGGGGGGASLEYWGPRGGGGKFPAGTWCRIGVMCPLGL